MFPPPFGHSNVASTMGGCHAIATSRAEKCDACQVRERRMSASHMPQKSSCSPLATCNGADRLRDSCQWLS
jgi:hypothetical protein